MKKSKLNIIAFVSTILTTLCLQTITAQVGCLKAIVSDNQNGVINLSCPENTVFNVIVTGNKCQCQHFNISINNIFIKTEDIDGLKNINFSKNELSVLNLLNINNVPSYTLQISCSNLTPNPWILIGEGQSVEYPIQVVQPGAIYSNILSKISNTFLWDIKTSTADNPKTSLCCMTDVSKAFSTAYASVSTDLITGLKTLHVYGGFRTFNHEFGKTIYTPFNQSFDWIDSTFTGQALLVDESDIMVINGQLNFCKGLGYKVFGEIHEIQKYEASCGGIDQKIGEPFFIKVPTSLKQAQFNLTPNLGCPRLPDFDDLETIYDITSCTGSILLNIPNTEDLVINWTDDVGQPIGSDDGNLKNVPLGKYTLNVSNNCCAVLTKTFTLCASIHPSEFIENFNGEWCRTISCFGQNCIERYQECFTPDYTQNIFDQNQKKCIKEYYYNNQLLGTTSVDATFETEWDDFWEECVTTYFCNGSNVFEDEYEPEDAEWIYDDFWEECRLNVNCMGEEMENVRQVEAEIEWEWDDFWEECVSNYITCDGMVVNDETSTDPYDFGDWTFTSSYCYRDIRCTFSGGYVVQQIPSEYNNTYEEGDCPDGLFVIEEICDGEVISEICGSAFQYPNTTNRAKLDHNISISIRGKNVLINLNKIYLDPVQVYISDVMGRTSQIKTIESGTKNIKINIENTLSGIYFINVIVGGKILQTQKILIHE